MVVAGDSPASFVKTLHVMTIALEQKNSVMAVNRKRFTQFLWHGIFIVCVYCNLTPNESQCRNSPILLIVTSSLAGCATALSPST